VHRSGILVPLPGVLPRIAPTHEFRKLRFSSHTTGGPGSLLKSAATLPAKQAGEKSRMLFDLVSITHSHHESSGIILTESKYFHCAHHADNLVLVLEGCPFWRGSRPNTSKTYSKRGTLLYCVVCLSSITSLKSPAFHLVVCYLLHSPTLVAHIFPFPLLIAFNPLMFTPPPSTRTSLPFLHTFFYPLLLLPHLLITHTILHNTSSPIPISYPSTSSSPPFTLHRLFHPPPLSLLHLSPATPPPQMPPFIPSHL